jgi:hypothetical protein
MSDCVFFGDRSYLSESTQLDLFHSANIKLEIQKRMNKLIINHSLIYSKNQEKE